RVDVVVPGHREVAWDPNAPLFGGPQDAERGDIGAREDGGWWSGSLQCLYRRVVSTLFRVGGHDDIRGEPVTFHRPNIAVAARGVGKDEGPLQASRWHTGVHDTCVTQSREVVDHETRTLEVVVHNRVETSGASVPRDHHGRHARRQAFQPGRGCPWRNQDQPVDLPIDERLDAALLALWGHARYDKDLLERSGLQLVGDSLDNLRLKGRRHLQDHHSNGV